MGYSVPSSDIVRAIALNHGVVADEEVLENVVGLLSVLLPQLEELERAIPEETVPAAFLLPEERA